MDSSYSTRWSDSQYDTGKTVPSTPTTTHDQLLPFRQSSFEDRRTKVDPSLAQTEHLLLSALHTAGYGSTPFHSDSAHIRHSPAFAPEPRSPPPPQDLAFATPSTMPLSDDCIDPALTRYESIYESMGKHLTIRQRLVYRIV